MAADKFTFELSQGEIPVAAGTSAFHIKGEFYRQLAGTIAHFDNKVDGALMREFDRLGIAEFAKKPFLSANLYDIVPMPWMMMGLARVLDRDVREMTSKVCHVAVEQQLDGVYKQLLGGLNAANFSARFVQIMKFLYDFGVTRMEAQPGGVTLNRFDIPACIAEWWTLATIPFVRVPILANGAKRVDITWRLEPSEKKSSLPLVHTIWDIRWE